MLTHLNFIYIKCLYSIHILSTRIALLPTVYVNIVYTSYTHASQSYQHKCLYSIHILLILQFKDKRLLIL